jgi:hypothetical protein
VDKDDIKRIQQELNEEGIDIRLTLMETRAKRLVKHMTTPWRLILGLPTAYLTAWLTNHHQVTSFAYLTAYGAWLITMFLIFWLYELHHWAGGTSKLD